MKAVIDALGGGRQMDFSQPLDISIPLRDGLENVNCFGAPLVEIWPVRMGDFVGDTSAGGFVNFKNVKLNPHGNGTHTECVGHISKEPFMLDQCLKQFFFSAELLSVYPERQDNGDRMITRDQIRAVLETIAPEQMGSAVILRTLPNHPEKKLMQYTGTNPTYVEPAAMDYLIERGVEHLLIDLPSVDREEDGGALKAHHRFWQYPDATRTGASITELIFVPDDIKDGSYFLQMQITSLQMDASPSKPVLYAIL